MTVEKETNVFSYCIENTYSHSYTKNKKNPNSVNSEYIKVKDVLHIKSLSKRTFQKTMKK